MPISSYLAHPAPGRGAELAQRIAAVPRCEVMPSEDLRMLIVVTDTEDESQERAVQDALRNIEGLDGLALVFCHDAPQTPVEDPT